MISRSTLLLVLALAACRKEPQVGRLSKVDPAVLKGPDDTFRLPVELAPIGRMGFTKCSDVQQGTVEMETGEVKYPFGPEGGTVQLCFVLFGELAHELDRHTYTVTARPAPTHSPEAAAAVVDPFVRDLDGLAKQLPRAKVTGKCPPLAGEIQFVDTLTLAHLAKGTPKASRAAGFVRSSTFDVMERPLDPTWLADVRYLAEKVPYVGIVSLERSAAPAVLHDDPGFLGRDRYAGGEASGTLYVADRAAGRIVCKAPLRFSSSKRIEWVESVRQGDPNPPSGLTPAQAQQRLDVDFQNQATAAVTAAAKKLDGDLQPVFRRRYRL